MSSHTRALLLRMSAFGVVATGIYVAGRSAGLTTVSGHTVARWLTGDPVLAPFLYVGLFGALNTLGFPIPILCAIAGVAFGTAQGTGLTVIAMLSTATVQFLLARFLGGDRLRTPLAQRLGRVGSQLQRRGTWAVAVARLLPGPFSEFNLAAGLSPVRLSSFLFGTLLGSVPKVVLWTGVGAVMFNA